MTESKKVSGWYTDTACTQLYDFNAPVESNITLYAKWVDRTYTVTFDSHGGSEVESQVVAYGKTASKPANPTKSGYVFSGWQSSNGAYSFSTPVTGDITLKASWQQEHAQGDWCKVTFDAAGGSEVEAQLVAGGSKVTRPADPTKEGYVFNGWALDGELFDFDKPVMQSITLVAVWEKQSADLIDISPAQVTLGKARLAYNGKVQTSSVASVVLNGKELAAGQDYIASIGGGKLVGTYKVTVTGVGSYTGSVTAAYDIVPAKVKGLKAKVVGKGKLKLAWTKNALQRDGVQVRYAVSKAKLKAGKGKAVKVKGAGAKAKTFKKLKSGKRYYFKVRAYKVVNGKTYWSGWSKVKSAKAK